VENITASKKPVTKKRAARRNSSVQRQDSTRICPEPGKPCAARIEFRLLDARINIATEPMLRADLCPHCFIDFLYDLRMIDAVSENVMQCDYSFYSDDPDSIRNGPNLLDALRCLALPPFKPINFHFDGGEA
jgi:hypothetical protein